MKVETAVDLLRGPVEGLHKDRNQLPEWARLRIEAAHGLLTAAQGDLNALRAVAAAARDGLALTKSRDPIVISPDDLVRLYELALRETEAALAAYDAMPLVGDDPEAA